MYAQMCIHSYIHVRLNPTTFKYTRWIGVYQIRFFEKHDKNSEDSNFNKVYFYQILNFYVFILIYIKYINLP